MDNEKIRKSVEFSESKAIDPEHGIYEAWISTEAIDRDGDIIVAAGVDIENYMKNPVVLFGHNYRDPNAVVGKTLGLNIEKGKGIRARWQFAPPEANWNAQTVHRLWAGGFLNATSVGFVSKEHSYIDEEGNVVEGREDARGILFEKWELLEFSIVPVPANQDALRLAVKAMGIDEVILDNYDASETITLTIPNPLSETITSEGLYEAKEEQADPDISDNNELTEAELDELAELFTETIEEIREVLK